jgi:hypothetical protein
MPRVLILNTHLSCHNRVTGVQPTGRPRATRRRHERGSERGPGPRGPRGPSGGTAGDGRGPERPGVPVPAGGGPRGAPGGRHAVAGGARPDVARGERAEGRGAGAATRRGGGGAPPLLPHLPGAHTTYLAIPLALPTFFVPPAARLATPVTVPWLSSLTAQSLPTTQCCPLPSPSLFFKVHAAVSSHVEPEHAPMAAGPLGRGDGLRWGKLQGRLQEACAHLPRYAKEGSDTRGRKGSDISTATSHP